VSGGGARDRPGATDRPAPAGGPGDDGSTTLEPGALAVLGRVVEFAPGDVLPRPGDEIDRVVIVLSRIVRVEQSSDRGRAIELYRVTAAEPCVLEVSSALSGRRYSARAVAQTEGRARAIASSRFAGALVEHPALQRHVFSLIADRLLEVMSLVEAVAFGKVEDRLAFLLAREADADGVVTATHADLAEHLGTAREVVSRLLASLEERGVVVSRRGSIELLPGFGAERDRGH
jgi:CRP/FNR family transcriptional regulator